MDRFTEPAEEGADVMNYDAENYDADSDDLRSHLNARADAEELFQDLVNVIHDIPVYPTVTTPIPYPYGINPMGIPDPSYQWWQHTPQYYAPPMYQFQPPPHLYPQHAYAPVPSPSAIPPVGAAAMNDPELRRAHSERRPPRLGKGHRCTHGNPTGTSRISPGVLRPTRPPNEALLSDYARRPGSGWGSETKGGYPLIALPAATEVSL
nr:uncharacterized protein LOC109155647 [Ipomoea trifida]